MKLNVTTVMNQVNGNPLLEADAKGEATELILRTVLINALMDPVKEDTGVIKVEKYDLALKIQKNDEVELSPEQVVLLKKAVEKPYGAVVVGPIWKLLDGKETDESAGAVDKG